LVFTVVVVVFISIFLDDDILIDNLIVRNNSTMISKLNPPIAFGKIPIVVRVVVWVIRLLV